MVHRAYADHTLLSQASSITVYDESKKENVALITALGQVIEREANPYDEEFDRIAIKDAERTFKSRDNRLQMIGMFSVLR